DVRLLRCRLGVFLANRLRHNLKLTRCRGLIDLYGIAADFAKHARLFKLATVRPLFLNIFFEEIGILAELVRNLFKLCYVLVRLAYPLNTALGAPLNLIIEPL